MSLRAARRVQRSAGADTREDLEAFLFHEAELLDTWALPQWVELFTEDCAYLIPTTDLPPDASPRTSLFYIADNHYRLNQRAVRLMKDTAYAEFPHSRMRRAISNIRLLGQNGEEITASCNFSATRTHFGRTMTYVGQIRYRLRRQGGALRIREKLVLLDHDGLMPHGRITAPL